MFSRLRDFSLHSRFQPTRMIRPWSCPLLAPASFLAPPLQPIHQRRISHPGKPRKLRSGHPATIILRQQRLAFFRWRPNAANLINLQDL